MSVLVKIRIFECSVYLPYVIKLCERRHVKAAAYGGHFVTNVTLKSLYCIMQFVKEIDNEENTTLSHKASTHYIQIF